MNKTGTQKTLLVVAPYFPPYGGGLEQYAQSIAHCLQNHHEWRVVVITSGAQGSADTRRLEDGIVVHRLGYQFKVSNTPLSLRWFGAVRRIIQEENPDVINVHTPVPGIGDIAAYFSGTRSLVVTYHALSMKKGRFLIDILIGLYERFLMRAMLNKASHIICSSDAVRFDFLHRYSYKSSTITPGVDCTKFSPDPALRTADPSILFVANLGYAEIYKGLSLLVDVLPILIRKHPRLTVTVVGDGGMRPEYERIVASQDLTSHVTFKGRLGGIDLVREYQKAHLFVLPTSHDSSPLVITEALACALPVVSCRTGGIPSIVHHGEEGLLIEPHDTDALENALHTLLSDSNMREKMGAAGRVRAETHFDWRARAIPYNDVLRASTETKPCIVQVSGYYPPHLGGVEYVIQKCAENLAERNHEVRVITSNIGSSAQTIVKKNLIIHQLRSIEFAHTPIAPSLLYQLLRLPKNSIVHFHLSQAYWPELTLCATWLKGIPYIVHFHLDVRPSGIFGFLFRVYKKIIWGPFLRCARRVIVLSDEQQALVHEKYGVPLARITVLPNGVDDTFFASPIHTDSHDVFELISVGRLAPQKRLERILEALPRITVPVHLTIVGEGEEREKLQALVAKLQLTNVSFVGYKNAVELRELLVHSDAFVISSEQEGMPLAVLEAFATGLPVIGANVPGIKNLVAGVGLVVDEPYAESIAQAIEKIARNPDLQKELSATGTLAARAFSWPKIIDQLDTLYTTIV